MRRAYQLCAPSITTATASAAIDVKLARVVTDPDDSTDQVPLGRPPALDPIGREIARMKVGDALFAKSEVTNEAVAEPAPARETAGHRRVIVVCALIAAVIVLAIAVLRW
jgi:hypothetical protein